jgi:MHS family proline/betaine transporter-like MFS transporter
LQGLAQSKKLVIAATTMGNILEWYEFGLYAYLAPTIAKLFFPPSDSKLQSVMSFLFIFAMGFISRPFGGMIFGFIGDRYGRRLSLLTSVLLMSVPTFIIGLLPTYDQIGIWSAVLLGMFRLIQGIPVGGEFPGTICYLIESASAKERGFLGSFAFFGSQLGILLNVIECLCAESFLTERQLFDWGWRVPFLFGGIIGLLGFYLRNKLKETPLFETLEKQDHIAKAPIYRVCKECKIKMLIGFFIGALPLGGFYQIFVFTSIYFEQFFHLSERDGLILSGLYLLLSTGLLPLIGRWADGRSIKKILIFSGLCVTILAFPFYYFAMHQMLILSVLSSLLLVFFISCHFAMISQAMAGLFPTSVRFTGLALSYNFSNILFAGFIPLLSLYLVQTTGWMYFPAFSLVVLSIISCIIVIPLRQRGGELEV